MQASRRESVQHSTNHGTRMMDEATVNPRVQLFEIYASISVVAMLFATHFYHRVHN